MVGWEATAHDWGDPFSQMTAKSPFWFGIPEHKFSPLPSDQSTSKSQARICQFWEPLLRCLTLSQMKNLWSPNTDSIHMAARCNFYPVEALQRWKISCIVVMYHLNELRALWNQHRQSVYKRAYNIRHPQQWTGSEVWCTSGWIVPLCHYERYRYLQPVSTK